MTGTPVWRFWWPLVFALTCWVLGCYVFLAPR